MKRNLRNKQPEIKKTLSNDVRKTTRSSKKSEDDSKQSLRMKSSPKLLVQRKSTRIAKSNSKYKTPVKTKVARSNTKSISNSNTKKTLENPDVIHTKTQKIRVSSKSRDEKNKITEENTNTIKNSVVRKSERNRKGTESAGGSKTETQISTNRKGTAKIQLNTGKGSVEDKNHIDKTSSILKQSSQIRKLKTTENKLQKGQSPLKKRKVLFDKEKLVKESPQIHKLRRRRTIKYAESTIDSSQSENDLKETKKVPVYNQPVREKKSHKRKGDLYDFDSDSENYKKRKKQALNDSEEYNNILKNVVKKAKAKPKKKIFSDKKDLKNIFKYNNNKVLKPVNTNRNVKINNTKSEPIPPKQNSFRADEQQNKNQNDGECDNFQNDVDDCFGFENKVETRTPKKIHVISNVVFKPRKELNFSLGSPAAFHTCQPDANSTMMNNILSPWRFNEINIRRNPHFITLKESSLPCINQDMVLDHTIVDKLENKLNMTSNRKPENKEKQPRKTQLQTTITDYVKGGRENKENMNVTLFDNDEFSPIQASPKHNVAVVSPKRRVLGERNIIESQSASTPVRSKTQSVVTEVSPDKPNELCTYFGFDTAHSTDIEENLQEKEKDNIPFRLSVNINDKKYKGKKVRRVRVESPIPSDDESVATDSENEGDNEVKLFDDVDDTENFLQLQEARIEELKLKRRREHKRKLKNTRSEQEEEEAEKWAAAFNSMCEEIEQFPLEVE